MAQLNTKSFPDELFIRLKVYVAGIKGMTIACAVAEAVREYLDRRRGVT